MAAGDALPSVRKTPSPQPPGVGEIAWGHAGETEFLMGRLRIGEAMSPPLMRQVKKRLDEMQAASPDHPKDVITDAPPGVSCPAINAVMDSDVIVLVTEPTPFGVYDMKLAHEAFTPHEQTHGGGGQPAGLGNSEIYDYCAAKIWISWQKSPMTGRSRKLTPAVRLYRNHQIQMKQIFLELAEKNKTKSRGGAP